jgi:hypothetical protein
VRPSGHIPKVLFSFAVASLRSGCPSSGHNLVCLNDLEANSGIDITGANLPEHAMESGTPTAVVAMVSLYFTCHTSFTILFTMSLGWAPLMTTLWRYAACLRSKAGTVKNDLTR